MKVDDTIGTGKIGEAYHMGAFQIQSLPDCPSKPLTYESASPEIRRSIACTDNIGPEGTIERISSTQCTLL